MQQISQRLPLSKIIDHPVNASIYRDNFDDDLVESIKQNGVLTPIVVCKHAGGSYVCLSGHRRRQAAGVLGLQEIPCLIYRDEIPEWQQVLMVVESNRQRTKTVEVLARETEALAKAKEQQAAARKAATLQKGQKKAPEPVTENFTERGEALDLAAKETGIGSRPTAKKAIEVVKKIDELEQAGKTEAAEELREALNQKSVSAAHRKATAEEEPEPEPDGVLDVFGVRVPDELAEIFATRSDYAAVLNQVTQLKKAVNGLLNGPGGRWLHKTEVDSLLKDLRRTIDFGQPHTECGMCQRDAKKRETCDACKHRGYVNQMAYGNQTAAAKVWLESR